MVLTNLTFILVQRHCKYSSCGERRSGKIKPEDGVLSCYRNVICYVSVQTMGKVEKYYVGSSFVNDQLDAQFFYFIIRLLQSSTCFEQRHANHQEVKLY